jgi:cell division protein FtsB
MGYHFISYSTVDAGDFAVRLVRELAAPPAVAVWLDKLKLRPGLDWDEQISHAIKECDSLLFVMTRDSVTAHSVCKREWTRALKYNKPVIPLRLHVDAELPFLLEPRQHVDFSADFATGLGPLRSHLLWMSEPAGVLRMLEERLASATRSLSRVPEQDRPRVVEEIADLERQIAGQRQAAEDLDATVRRLRRRREDRPSDPPVAVSATPARKVTAWDPAVLERARRDLAVYIGPMAKVIVVRAAERALSMEELYGALAAEIGSPSDRQKFLATRPL